MNKNRIAEDCGRFFEVGFNIGMLTYLRQHEQDFVHHIPTLYAENLSELNFPDMARNAFRRAKFSSAEGKRKIVRQWFLFFFRAWFSSRAQLSTRVYSIVTVE